MPTTATTNARGRYQCPDCPADALSPGGLGVHRYRKHGHTAPKTNGKKPGTALAVRHDPPDDDPRIVLVLRTDQGGVPVADAVTTRTDTEAHELAGFLGRLGHRTFVLNPSGPSVVEFDRDGEIG